MKKIILITTFVAFYFNTSAFSEETKCSVLNIGCKIGKFASDTKKFQKEKWSINKKKSNIPKKK